MNGIITCDDIRNTVMDLSFDKLSFGINGRHTTPKKFRIGRIKEREETRRFFDVMSVPFKSIEFTWMTIVENNGAQIVVCIEQKPKNGAKQKPQEERKRQRFPTVNCRLFWPFIYF